MLDEPLEYDLTIRDVGPHAISIGPDGATATPHRVPAPALHRRLPCAGRRAHARRAARGRAEAHRPLARPGARPRPPPRGGDAARLLTGSTLSLAGRGPGRRGARARPRLPPLRLRHPAGVDGGAPLHGRPGGRRPDARAVVRHGRRRRARRGRAPRAGAAGRRHGRHDAGGVRPPPARRAGRRGRDAGDPRRPRRGGHAQGLDGPRPGPLTAAVARRSAGPSARRAFPHG